ncbi:MAG TPA: OmpA family protein [Nitrospinota bacterium]|nr:OmpA family protein [Nitrospinota bacterium]
MKINAIFCRRFLLLAFIVIFISGCASSLTEPFGKFGTPEEFTAAKAAIKEAQRAGANTDKAKTLMAKAEETYRACKTDKGIELAIKAKEEADKALALVEPKKVAGVMMPAEPIVEKKIVLRGINFDFNKAEIKPEFKPVLDEAVRILKDNPKVNVIIGGHTCNMGPDRYNERLSERRASSVKEYFIKQGVDSNRLKSIGYGESRPITDNRTSEKRRMNRRVEIKAVK